MGESVRRSVPLTWIVGLVAVASACAPAATHRAAPGDAAAAEAAAAPADTQAVLSVMDRLFDAMRTRDTAAIRALAHPELRLFVPLRGDAGPTVRIATLDEFVRSIAAATDVLDERPFRPEVRIDDGLATIWTYYEFRRGDAFSHCGYDAFHLARDAGGWRIVGLAYTMRRDDCLDEWRRDLR